jgi:trimeric autotransporter adhesin
MAQITGTAGNDTLDGGLFRDTIDGLGGDDTIDGHGSNDTLNGGAGDDTIFGSDGDDTISGGDSGDDPDHADYLDGGSGNDIIHGDDGFDYLIGGWGSDELFGGAGTDVIEFSWEDNAVDGGSGDDTLYGNPMGAVTGGVIPVLEGGSGSDWLAVHFIYDSASNTFISEASISASLLFGFATYSYDDNGSPAAFTTFLSGIENLQGGMLDDTLTGDLNDNVIIGGSGDDTLSGSDGDDTLLSGFNYAHELLTREPAGTLGGPGGDGNVIDGGDGEDHIHAFGVNDDISGGDGDDTIWVDDGISAAIDGGEDTDTLYLHGNRIGPVLGASGNITGIEVIGFHDGGGLNLYNSNPQFNIGLDITLDASLGGSPDDGILTVIAADGDDSLDGSQIADSVTLVLEGGKGDDIFENVASANIVGGDSFAGGDGIDTLDLDEYLASWGGPAVLVGGNSTVTGVEIINLHGSLTAGGINFIELAIPLANTSSTGNITVNGYGLARDFIDGSRIANSTVSLFLNGNGGDDVLTGGAGADMLNGGAGGDAMAGGLGSDTYLVDSTADSVTENTFGGLSDGVIASVDFTLGANLEELGLSGTADIDGTGNGLGNEIGGNSGRNYLYGLGGTDHLYGGAGDDNLFGGEGNDTLEGGSEADELDGGTGADIMKGGTGNDSYVIDKAPVFDGNGVLIEAGDVVIELANEGGSDLIMSSVNTVLFANVENLWLTGTANLSGVGNFLDNLIVGNGAANALTGITGNDHLYGFGGNDALWGGAGADALDGGEGSDTALYTGSAAVTIDLGAQVYLGGDAVGDTLTGIENVAGSAFGDGLIGDAAANILSGAAGDDQLTGLAGADTLFGGADNDTLTGNSFGIAFNFTDTLYGGGGNDNLYVGIGGNAIMNGDSGDDTLSGLSGVDTMRGGLGDDFIYGAQGNDLFQFHTADFADGDADIVYFVDAGDRLQFSSGMNGALYFQDLPSLEYAPGQFTTGVYVTAFLGGGDTATITVYGTTVASLMPLIEYSL